MFEYRPTLAITETTGIPLDCLVCLHGVMDNELLDVVYLKCFKISDMRIKNKF